MSALRYTDEGETIALLRRRIADLEALVLGKPAPRFDQPRLTIAPIVADAAAASGFSVRDLMSQRRPASIAQIRFAIYWAARTATGRSLPDIGRAIGDRDHTTILYGLCRAEQLRLSLLADETHDGMERFQNYGLTSVPLPGAEAVAVFPAGLRSHGIVVAVEDRRYRMHGLKEGEVALYDDLGQSVKLGRDGIVVQSDQDVTIVVGNKATLRAAEVVIDCNTIALGVGAGKAVARVGDNVVNGKIVSGSEQVSSA